MYVNLYWLTLLTDKFQALKDELEATQTDIEGVHETGLELVSLIGEPDKPEVEKNIEEVDTAWGTLENTWAKRQEALKEALSTATSFQDELMVCGDQVITYFT